MLLAASLNIAASSVHAQNEIALKLDTQDIQLPDSASPAGGLELKLSTSPDLATVDLTVDSPDIWTEIRKGFSIPDLQTQDVTSQEKVFLKHKRLVEGLLKRSEPYIYYIAQQCEKRGMPSELALLPFVESQFNPKARSRAAAEGLWQFIPSTGRQFDLKQNKWVDERRDLVASTRAALDYLSYLYNMHGDWHLALISYNWGEGSVLKAMKKAEEAGRQPVLTNLDLPSETREYIPKLQALKNLVLSPEQFDITLPMVPNRPYFTKIKRNSDVDLRDLARLAGIELDDIQKLNPGLKQPVLYAAHSNTLLVPVEHSEKVQTSLENYRPRKLLGRTYKVQKGDTLGAIANQFQVKIKDIEQLNNLNKKSSIRPGMVLHLPGDNLKLAESSAS